MNPDFLPWRNFSVKNPGLCYYCIIYIFKTVGAFNFIQIGNALDRAAEHLGQTQVIGVIELRVNSRRLCHPQEK